MKEVVKFQLQDLLPIGMVFIVFGIAITYGLDIMQDISDEQTAGSYAKNASEDALSGVAKLPEKLPTLATVVVAAIVIGVLVTYLWGRMK